MARITTDSIIEGLTFDDVLLRPAAVRRDAAEVNVATRLTRSITLNLPILSSAMDTVTEAGWPSPWRRPAAWASSTATSTVEEQADQVREVKRYECGMVLNPITIHPDATLAERSS